jgi:hypothetical protein
VTADTDAYRRLFESHPVAMAIWDPATGRLIAINDAAATQYGYAKEEAPGLPVDRLVHPDDWPRLRERLRTMPTGHVGGETFRHLRRDGSTIEVEMTGHEVLFEGRPARVVMALDVTARRTLEGQLREAQRMEAVGHLAGGIAHDFNNLLMVINGFGEMLVGRLPAGEELEAAQQILAAGERAAALTRQLLAFASPGVERAEILDLAAIVGGVLPLLERTLGEHIVVSLETTARDPWVAGERAKFEQVLVNLAVNARDAMPDGGRVTIELSDAPAGSPGLEEMANGALLLSVSDTGRGIAEEIRERVFLPFFTTKADRGGSGLGLATVHATARASGGRVWVERTGRRGATIRFMIPRVAGPPSTDSAAAAGPGKSDADPDAVRDTARLILVAEDEPAVLALLERVLRTAGYGVIGVPSGPEALDAAMDRLDDLALLVTDAIMPGMAGLELARLLRLERPNLPVLFVSGWASDAFEREWAGQAGVDLLIKPFDVAELLVRVATLTARGAGGRTD